MAPRFTFLPLGCPLCRTVVTLWQTSETHYIFTCKRCNTTVLIPEDAWDQTAMIKRKISATL